MAVIAPYPDYGLPWPFSLIDDLIEEFWNWIGDASNEAVKWLRKKIDGQFSNVANWVWYPSVWLADEVLGPKVNEVISKLSLKVLPSLATLTFDLGKLPNQMWTPAIWLADVSLGPKLDTLLGKFPIAFPPFPDITTELGEMVTEVVGKIPSGVGEVLTLPLQLIEDGISGGFATVFQSLSDMIEGFTEGFGTALTDSLNVLAELSETFINFTLGSIDTLKTTVEGTIRPLLLEGMDLFGTVVVPGSPDEEIKEKMTFFVEEMFARMEGLAEHEHESVPPWETVRNKALLYSGIISTVVASINLLGMALDATHPVKHWQFREAFADTLEIIMPQMGIGAVLQMPFEVGTLRFLQYHLQEQYRPTLPTVGDLIAMVRRKSLTIDEMGRDLAFQGYQNEYIQGFKGLVWQIPGPGDLVRFLVREVIIPDEFNAFMGLQGFSVAFSEMFWDAHWVLPSIGSLYEMFWRGQITETKLREMIIKHDYAAEWHDPLIKIAYNLITRVDARRGWEMGELQDPDLDRLYEHSGYSPDDAKLVTKIQKYATLEAERGELMRRAIDLFTEGWIDPTTLKGYLLSFLPREEIVDFRVAAAETERDINEREAWVGIFREQFRKDAITDTVFRTKLEVLQMQPWRIEAEISKEMARKGIEVEIRI